MPLSVGYGCGAAARSPRPAIWSCAGFQPLKWMNRSRRALAITNTAFSTYFDFKDGLAAALVFDHHDIPKLKAHCLVWAEAGIGCEENVVVKLFRFPTEAGLLGIEGAFSRRFVELLVLFWREPGSMGDLRRRAIRL